jgi:hypothetical protein
MIYFVRLFLKEHQWKVHQLLPNAQDVKLVIEKFKNKR